MRLRQLVRTYPVTAAIGSSGAPPAGTTLQLRQRLGDGIGLSTPTIDFSRCCQDQTYGAAPFGVSATSNSTGAITYSVVSGPATISGSTVTTTGAGSVTLKASEQPTATMLRVLRPPPSRWASPS